MKKMLLLATIAIPLLVFAEEKAIGYLGVTTEALSQAMITALDVEHGSLSKRSLKNHPRTRQVWKKVM